jgi:mgtE-like transporter
LIRSGVDGDVSVRSVLRENYRGALPTLLVSGAGGLLAGSILGGMRTQLAAVPGLLVMVPAFLAIRGSVYGSLGSRLSGGIHQGLIDPTFEPDRRLVGAAAAALLNGTVAGLVAATLTVGALRVLGRAVAPLPRLAFIALVGSLLAGLALTATIVTVVFVGYRRGLNPDDVVGPTVTTAGDVFGLAALALATELALAFA